MSSDSHLVRDLRRRIRDLSREVRVERARNEQLRAVALVGTGMLLGLDERQATALRELYPEEEPVNVDRARDLLDRYGLLDLAGA
ncbi:MAG: hypothetical protein JJT89_06550 [Nitriliruptoraceae bacterium]|nr:hypothetical protein [Nitriliruptoraceae bacterium]